MPFSPVQPLFLLDVETSIVADFFFFRSWYSFVQITVSRHVDETNLFSRRKVHLAGSVAHCLSAVRPDFFAVVFFLAQFTIQAVKKSNRPDSGELYGRMKLPPGVLAADGAKKNKKSFIWKYIWIHGEKLY